MPPKPSSKNSPPDQTSALPDYIAKSKTNAPMAKLWLSLLDTDTYAEDIVAKAASADCGLERKYIATYSDPNSGALRGNSILPMALKANRRDVVKLLLSSHKINLRNATGCNNFDVFTQTTLNNDVEFLALFLKYDPKAFAHFSNGCNPPLLAAMLKNIPNARAFLLQQGIPARILVGACKKLSDLNVSVVKELLAMGCDPNITDTSGLPPLLEICKHAYPNRRLDDRVAIARSLIEHGANVNAADSATKKSALHLAVQDDSLRLVKILVAKGSHLNCLDSDGYTPLHYAKSSELRRYLSGEGATKRAERSIGAKRSRCAVSESNPQAASLLSRYPDAPLKALWAALRNTEYDHEVSMAIISDLDLGAEQRNLESLEGVSDARNLTPLGMAVEANRHDVVAALIASGVNLKEPKGRLGRTPLTIAIRKGYLAIASTLIGSGADPNTDDCLLSAVHSKEATKLLIDNGVNVNPHGGYPPVQYAACREKLGALDLLIDNGAELSRRYQGSNALLDAVRSIYRTDSFDLANHLIEVGIELNERDDNGNTALHNALLFLHNKWSTSIPAKGSRLSELLVKKGASVALPNKKGHTALHLGYLAPNLFPLMCAAQEVSNTTVNLPDKWGSTPLHAAMQAEQKHSALMAEGINILICKGASLTSVDIRRMTPLHVAASECQAELVELLVAKGSDITALDKSNRTPLDVYRKLGKPKAKRKAYALPSDSDQRIKAALGKK